MRLVLIVEYEGTEYGGFQYQDNAPSIQQELERALFLLTGEQTRVAPAGRTDAGVHAEGQVVAFDTSATHPPRTFVKALNHYLPEDIAIRGANRTSDTFDPRRMATSRRYVYSLYRGRTRSPLNRRHAFQVTETLNIRRMRESAGAFIGKHDFSRFAAGGSSSSTASTTRDIYTAQVSARGKFLHFNVEGNAFLTHQVRRMAGALVDVGRGVLTIMELEAMIEGDGQRVAHALPPQGLCLVSVSYAGIDLDFGETDGIAR